MKKILFFIVLLMIAVSSNAQQHAVIQSTNKIGSILGIINNAYVDSVEIEKLSEKAIVAIFKALDPHSVYLSKEEFQAANEPLTGNFEGIGVEFNILNDTLIIVMPVSGGPSEKVGILAGDKIVAVDGENIAGVNITNNKIFKLLRGKKGTKVMLDIVRRNVREILPFEVTRDKIPLNSIDAVYEVRPGVAYLKLGRFAGTSMQEIFSAFAKFENNPEALILDLRGNGGGVMETSIQLTDQFLEREKMIVYTSGAHGKGDKYYSTDNGIFKTGKLVILINESSASASEIVSGAIQDWDRGILIGRRTYGKGLVQSQLGFQDGSAIRLTTLRYHTPTGRAIQRPYEQGNAEQYVKDFYERYTNGEVYDEEKINFPDSLKYTTLNKKRTVYGGGGIMPDIFIPQDTSQYTPYYAKLINRGILHSFILTYVSENRDELKAKYPTFEQFATNFNVDDVFLEKLVVHAEKESLPRNNEELKKSSAELKILMKAICARDLWSSTEYFRITNASIDKEFDKAIEVIDNWDTYEKQIFGKH